MATRLRKKCPDCGKRGNWHKKLIEDPCPECASIRLKHDAIRVQYYDRCARRAEGNLSSCHPSKPPMCKSCEEYFAGPTHAFFTRLR